MKQQEIEQSAKKISIDRSAIDQERILGDAEAALEASRRHETSCIRIPLRGRFPLLFYTGTLAAALLFILSWLACLVLHREVKDLRNELSQRDVAVVPTTDDSATINLYFKEHQDTIARYASLNVAESQPVQMRINQDDIMYYEILDEQPEYMRPGLIVKGPLSQHQIGSTESPVISNGHILTLSEARQEADFKLLSTSWFHPGYRLDQIRRIEGRDALHLLYTDGTNTISLFEQPLDGQRVLEPKDFREYAVYRNKGKTRGTILAWKDDTLSYVLISNVGISQLMNIAQVISARK